jgi:UPF0755 protein
VKIFFAFSAVFLLALALFSGFYYYSLSAPLSDNMSSVNFQIRPGESTVSILARLEGQHVIRSALATRIYLKLHRIENKFVPGEFLLPVSAPTLEIIRQLMKGPQDVWVTFPEGWRREQIAARLQSINPNIDYASFIKNTATLEGQLFPDSYLLPKDITASQAITMLTSNFVKKTHLTVSNPEDQRILIIASLIEREANNSADRPLISSVIVNRLKIGMALQIDASVQYAIDSQTCQKHPLTCTWWQPIFATKFPSVFNTYLHPDLPPAPICNPGLSSIQAAKNPAKSTYFFYLTGNDGVTRFAQDSYGHQANIDKYLRP